MRYVWVDDFLTNVTVLHSANIYICIYRAVLHTVKAVREREGEKKKRVPT